MNVSIKKWGNSASVRIPASIMQAAHLTVDCVVDIREEGGRVIIEHVRRVHYELDELLASMTDENQHESKDFGPPIGNEIW